MKVLIIGNAYSSFNLGFASHLKRLDTQVEVDILNYYYERDLNKRVINGGAYGRIFHYYSDIPKIIAAIPLVRESYFKLKAFRNLGRIKKRVNEYDVILIQGFWEHSCKIFFNIINRNTFAIGAFWGSDFYKSNNFKLLQQTVERCNKVIISTKSMEKDIKSMIHIKNSKIANCLFGVRPMEVIFELLHVSKDVSKKKLGVKEDLKVITCGYNGKVYQQHLEIISQLMVIKNRLNRENVLLLFPMTYGLDADYLSKIEAALAPIGIEYKIITEFLSDEKVAYIRKATDIFIQLQTTDANSGSMREHLCCQNIVITGSWLPYEHLIEEDIFFETIESVEGLAEKLLYTLDNYRYLENQVASINTPDKFRKSLWSEAIKDWHKVLSSYKEHTHGN